QRPPDPPHPLQTRIVPRQHPPPHLLHRQPTHQPPTLHPQHHAPPHPPQRHAIKRKARSPSPAARQRTSDRRPTPTPAATDLCGRCSHRARRTPSPESRETSGRESEPPRGVEPLHRGVETRCSSTELRRQVAPSPDGVAELLTKSDPVSEVRTEGVEPSWPE